MSSLNTIVSAPLTPTANGIYCQQVVATPSSWIRVEDMRRIFNLDRQAVDRIRKAINKLADIYEERDVRQAVWSQPRIGDESPPRIKYYFYKFDMIRKAVDDDRKKHRSDFPQTGEQKNISSELD